MFQIPSDPVIRRQWCNLIKRQDGKDGFKITESTRVCEKHFEPSMVYRPPGGTRKRLLEHAKPILHSWNCFRKNNESSKRSAPKQRLSPRKKLRVDLDPEPEEEPGPEPPISTIKKPFIKVIY